MYCAHFSGVLVTLKEPRSFKAEVWDQTCLALPICAGLLSTQAGFGFSFGVLGGMMCTCPGDLGTLKTPNYPYSSLVGSQVVNTVSTVLVGHLGARDLAAVGLAVSLANVTGYSVTWR